MKAFDIKEREGTGMPEDFKEGDELLVLSNFSSRTTDNLDALSLSDGQQGTVTSLFLASFDSDNLKLWTLLSCTFIFGFFLL